MAIFGNTAWNDNTSTSKQREEWFRLGAKKMRDACAKRCRMGLYNNYNSADAAFQIMADQIEMLPLEPQTEKPAITAGQ